MIIRAVAFGAMAVVSLFGLLDGYMDLVWAAVLGVSAIYGRSFLAELTRDGSRTNDSY